MGKFNNMPTKDKIYTVCAIILFIAMFFCKGYGPLCLLLAGVLLLPITHSLLQRFKIYISDVMIVISVIILIIIASILTFLTIKEEKEKIHHHTPSGWVYDKETGFEINKCTGCGEITEKRIPDIDYSTISPDSTESPTSSTDDYNDGNEQENEQKDENENEGKVTEEDTEGQKTYDDSNIEREIEEETKD